jgi:hypothetical protein
MPIKDIEQRYYLPRLGKIHLGVKNPINGAPVRTDYFVCPPEVQAVFGPKPKQLRIMIPVSNAELWRSEYYRYYTRSRGLICKGDGEKAVQLRDIANGQLPTEKSKEFAMVDIDCAGKDCAYKQNRYCRRVMNLQFLIHEVPGLGVWQIDTSSNTSITNIKSGELFIKAIYGRITMIPLILELKPVEKTNLTDGKKHSIYAMYLNTSGTLQQLAETARQSVAIYEIDLTGKEETDDDEPDLIEVSPEEKIAQAGKDIEELWADGKVVDKTTGEVKQVVVAVPHPAEDGFPTPEDGIRSGIKTTSDDDWDKIIQADVPPADNILPNGLNLTWIKESLAALQSKKLLAWSNVTLATHLRSMYQVEGETLTVMVGKLTKEQVVKFVAEISKALESFKV